MTIAAVFDLDGTLYTGRIVTGIARHHYKHRIKLVPLYTYMAIHYTFWGLSKVGLVPEVFARTKIAENMGWTVWGLTIQRAAQAFTWIAQHYVLPQIRSDVQQRLEKHRAAGHRLLIVSGTPAPLLSEIGRQLGVEETVGTPLVLRNGCYTGGSESPACQGDNKIRRLEMYLEDHDPISWDESVAYADSHTDIKLLSRFGNPVAVYPDSGLAEYAQTHQWEILGNN